MHPKVVSVALLLIVLPRIRLHRASEPERLAPPSLRSRMNAGALPHGIEHIGQLRLSQAHLALPGGGCGTWSRRTSAHRETPRPACGPRRGKARRRPRADGRRRASSRRRSTPHAARDGLRPQGRAPRKCRCGPSAIEPQRPETPVEGKVRRQMNTAGRHAQDGQSRSARCCACRRRRALGEAAAPAPHSSCAGCETAARIRPNVAKAAGLGEVGRLPGPRSACTARRSGQWRGRSHS